MLRPNLEQCVKHVDKVSPHLLVLLMYEARHLLEAFLVVSLGTEIDDVSGQTSHAPLTIPRKEKKSRKELADQIIRGAGALFSLSVKRVEGADGVVKKRSVNEDHDDNTDYYDNDDDGGGTVRMRPVNFPLQLSWESGGKLHSRPLQTFAHTSREMQAKPIQTWEKSRWTKTFLQFA